MANLAAEQGEASAQFNVALIYARGDGIKADQAKACHWFIKAAQQNSADAQYAAGACYQYGMGVEADDKKPYAGINSQPLKAMSGLKRKC